MRTEESPCISALAVSTSQLGGPDCPDSFTLTNVTYRHRSGYGRILDSSRDQEMSIVCPAPSPRSDRVSDPLTSTSKLRCQDQVADISILPKTRAPPLYIAKAYLTIHNHPHHCSCITSDSHAYALPSFHDKRSSPLRVTNRDRLAQAFLFFTNAPTARAFGETYAPH